MTTAAKEGDQLIRFPEAALSGYVFCSLTEAVPSAEPVPGPSTERIAEACRELKAIARSQRLQRGPWSAIHPRERVHQDVVGLVQGLRDHAHVGHHRHEVGVARPAGHQV